MDCRYADAGDVIPDLIHDRVDGGSRIGYSAWPKVFHLVNAQPGCNPVLV
jgi:hypothetical protein